MTLVRKRSLRDLAAMALSGCGEVQDAGLVLAHSLEQLRLSVDALVNSIELGGMEKADLQGHLIGLQYRCAALKNFTGDCISVEFLPLGDESTAEAVQ